MNNTYLFAMASILTTASLMAGTFTVATSFAQGTTTPESDMGSAVMDTGSSNMTGGGGNATYGGGNATAEANTGNSTAPI